MHRLRAGLPGIHISVGARYIYIFFPKYTDRLWGSPKPLFNVYQFHFSRAKWPWRDVDQQQPCRLEFKNEWSYTSNPPIAFLTSVRTTVPF